MNVVLLLDLLYGGVERKEERNERARERKKITSAENKVKRDELSYAIVVAFLLFRIFQVNCNGLTNLIKLCDFSVPFMCTHFTGTRFY